jgi:hypothetical protein
MVIFLRCCSVLPQAVFGHCCNRGSRCTPSGVRCGVQRLPTIGVERRRLPNCSLGLLAFVSPSCLPALLWCAFIDLWHCASMQHAAKRHATNMRTLANVLCPVSAGLVLWDCSFWGVLLRLWQRACLSCSCNASLAGCNRYLLTAVCMLGCRASRCA